MENSYIFTELKRYIDAEGRLIKYPKKRKLKIIAMFYLAQKFEAGKKYTEKEVNEKLKEWHTFEDWAVLRRDLYDFRFMDRESNGSSYWLEETQPTPAEYGIAIDAVQ